MQKSDHVIVPLLPLEERKVIRFDYENTKEMCETLAEIMKGEILFYPEVTFLSFEGLKTYYEDDKVSADQLLKDLQCGPLMFVAAADEEDIHRVQIFSLDAPSFVAIATTKEAEKGLERLDAKFRTS